MAVFSVRRGYLPLACALLWGPLYPSPGWGEEHPKSAAVVKPINAPGMRLAQAAAGPGQPAAATPAPAAAAPANAPAPATPALMTPTPTPTPTPTSTSTPSGAAPLSSEPETAATGPLVPGSPLPPSTPPADYTQRPKWLSERIDQILQVLSVGRARVGVAVLDVDSGKLIYGKNDGTPFNVASNVKLFTTAAALALLGPEYRFKTAVYGDRDKDQRGGDYKNLYLRGFGDPSLSTEDLWRLVSDLSARGVKRVRGDVVIDDTFFDEQRVGPAFEQKNQDSAYRAPQGAVSLNYNAIGVRVLPGLGDGQPVRISLDPPSQYILVSNEARTVATGRTSLLVDAQEEKDAPPGREHTLVRVRGTMRITDGPQDFSKRVAHPDLYAGYTLHELLQKRGIQIGGRVVHGTAPPGAQLLEAHYSQPLGALAREINKRSNNFMAEQVLKALGADSSGKPGSWQKGLQAISRYLEGLGILPGRYQMVNGSGLFDSNRFTPGQVVLLLRGAYRDFRYAADFLASLALAGADGTIAHRLTGTPAERFVRAKTGTLNGISCVSGYAGAPQPGNLPVRAPLAFSILVNDPDEGPIAPMKRLQDAILEALVAYQTGPVTK